MDHNAYEKEMIDTVNRHAREKNERISLITHNDKRILTIGLKRILLALLTAAMFAISVVGFIAVATAPGYLAVVLFIISLVALGCGFIFLYAQGIGYAESKGDDE